MLKSAVIDEEAGTLTIVMELEPPTASASGKTMVISSTRGNAETDVMITGRPLIIGVNAYFKP